MGQAAVETVAKLGNGMAEVQDSPSDGGAAEVQGIAGVVEVTFEDGRILAAES